MQTFTVHVTYCGITSTYEVEAPSGREAVQQIRDAFGPNHLAFVVLGF